MKKTLLLSVVASGFLFAGGDIAPVEPAVVTPAPAPDPAPAPVATGWKFSGQGVVYYQTGDAGPGSLFHQSNSAANAGLQLTATNDNLIGGIGFGAQLNGLGTLGLEKHVVSGVMQYATTPTVDASGKLSNLNGAYLSQLYLTYGIDNTSFKIGRQELPKALSPFAYSEDWNVFKNTYNAAVVVNTDLPNTTLVGAWVRDLNKNKLDDKDKLGANMNDFSKINGKHGVWMLTAQNKSIPNLTLTGSFYYGKDYANIFWADAQYNAGVANIGLQGGLIDPHPAGEVSTKAVGAKVSGKLDIVNAYVAYSHVNNGATPVLNLGGSTSVLYTDTVASQLFLGEDLDCNKYVVGANADVLGGNLAGAYALRSDRSANNTKEFDLVYSTNITNSINASLAYAYVKDKDFIDPDNKIGDHINVIRAVARYNF